MKTYVFIGGQMDGHRMPCPDHLTYVRVTVADVYVRSMFRDSDGTLNQAFVAESFSGSLMQALLDNYRCNPVGECK